MSDKDTPTVEGDDSRASPQNWKEGIVTHTNLEIRNAFVGDEGRLVRKHVVSRSRISDGDARGRDRRDGRSCQPTEDRLKVVRDDEAG